jgi:hypothetical protein
MDRRRSDEARCELAIRGCLFALFAALVQVLQILRADGHFSWFSRPRVPFSLVIVAIFGMRVAATTKLFAVGAETRLTAKWRGERSSLQDSVREWADVAANAWSSHRIGDPGRFISVPRSADTVS